jgi:hypothetical protein
MERASVLNRAGWKIVHVPHHKWYKHGWMHKVDSEAFIKVIAEFHIGMKTALGYTR